MATTERAELHGVSGWLALFVFILAAATPVHVGAGLVQLYTDPQIRSLLGDRFALFEAIEWATSALTVIACWYFAWRLATVRSWQTVRIVVAGIWALGLLIPSFGLAAGVILTPMPLWALAGGYGIQLARAMVFSFVWTAYLLKSRRVANTYNRPADEMREVFG